MARPLPKPKATSVHRNRLFFFNYEKNPSPINVTNFFTTANLADRNSSHPFHIRTVRRLEQFDPTKLHFSVIAPSDLSNRAFVRDRAARRVREAFQQELRREGWDPDGRRRPEGGSDGNIRSFDLSGALKLGLVKESFAVTATSEEVKQSVSWAVKQLARLQSDDEQQQRRPSKPYDPTRKRSNDRAAGAKTQGVTIRRITH